jgi:hypothetical protein
MHRAMEVSLLVLAFSITNIGLSATGFAQDAAGQDNVIKKSVDLVSRCHTGGEYSQQKQAARCLGGFSLHHFDGGSTQLLLTGAYSSMSDIAC